MSSADVAPTAAPPRRLGRWAWAVTTRALAVLLGVYLVLLGYLFAQQTGMIFPGSSSQGQAWAVLDAPPPGAELVRLRTASGETVVALFGPALEPDGSPAVDAAARPSLIFFYGNGDFLRNAAGLHTQLRRLGVNVLVPEYVGYGMSSGEPSEAACYETADAAYEHLCSRRDVDPSRIVAGGWSLGAASAVDLASRRRVAGLATFSAFTSMADMAKRFYGFMPGLTRVLRHHFESERKLSGVGVPVFIAHGGDDPMVPASMADRLAAAARGRVTRVDLPGVGHDDIFAAGGPRLLRAFGDFLGSV